jgi:hypothetical protein
MITGENGCSPMQVATATQENGGNRGRSNATGTDNTSKVDGMQRYNAKIGYIEVRFMTGNSKVFNVARALKLPSSSAAAIQRNTILPLAGIINNLSIRADVPNSKAGIEQYFRHDFKFDNINGKLRIQTSQGLG